jgi:hypothetical protein
MNTVRMYFDLLERCRGLDWRERAIPRWCGLAAVEPPHAATGAPFPAGCPPTQTPPRGHNSTFFLYYSTKSGLRMLHNLTMVLKRVKDILKNELNILCIKGHFCFHKVQARHSSRHKNIYARFAAFWVLR